MVMLTVWPKTTPHLQMHLCCLCAVQAACLAKCNGANVSLHRYGSFSLQEFRQAVADVCASGEEHLVVSYSRKAFSQTGDGHFSPVGGYHAARDLVLILDTVRVGWLPKQDMLLGMFCIGCVCCEACTDLPITC
jgi:hypothetical protein